ncbi:MAG: tRNA pseudouridine(55) synthase TruB [Pirellulaceae bacterium]|nr:tRNA pseudouridine(55) synthase TruB [Pirellulaceae bacterium]
MFGLLNLDKPSGLTSRDVVDRVQALVRPLKVGHAGTLDPLARGVLIVCVGQATRLIPYVQRMAKHYRGTFLLGRESDTEDCEGTVRLLDSPPVPSRGQLADALPRFVGRIPQVPPAYSALKVGGRRAYELARQGQQVELAAREVQIHSLELVEYDYPEFSLDVVCGAGTYVRSLGRDVARAVGSQAVMSDLVRTAIGPFRREDALAVDRLSCEAVFTNLLPARRAVIELPQLDLSPDELAKLRRGQSIPNRQGLNAGEIAGLDDQGELAALLTVADDGRCLRPTHNFGSSQ